MISILRMSRNDTNISYVNSIQSLHVQFPKQCNLDCWFCTQRTFKEKHDYSKISYVNETLFPKLAEELNKINKPCNINLVGGEVTLYDLEHLFSMIHNEYLQMHITTNGTNFERIRQCNKICIDNGMMFSFSGSLHETEVDYRKWMADLPRECGLKSIHVVVTKDNHEFVKRLMKEYPNEPFNLQPDWNNQLTDAEDTVHVFKFIDENGVMSRHGRHFIRNYINSFNKSKRKICISGYNLDISDYDIKWRWCVSDKQTECTFGDFMLNTMKSCKCDFCNICQLNFLRIDDKGGSDDID